MKATLIHCRGSGSATDEAFERACEKLSPHFELETFSVDGREHDLTELARSSVGAGSRVLIASGGDGTVSAVATAAIRRPDVRLGILPHGTANSIAAHFGIPEELELACEIVAAGRERVVDTAEVNGKPMILLATLGIHAEAITDVPEERKRRYGALAYVIEEVRKLAGDSLFDVTLETGGKQIAARVSAITVANFAPPTTLFAQGPGSLADDDGLLDVTLVAIEGLADAALTSLHLAAHALVGLPSDRDNIAFFRTDSLRIVPEQPRRLMVDGDDCGEGSVSVQCIPRSLHVCVPAGP